MQGGILDRTDAAASIAPRRDFPLVERVAYLNSAGMGLIPLPVQERALGFARRIGVEGTLTFFSSFDDIMLAPRRAAARLFNAPVECIAIVNSVSEAISQIAAWRRPKAGENVVVIDIDHCSTSYPWMRQAQDTGAEIRFVKAADDPKSLSFDRIAALVDHNTAAISVSHVQWTTGLRLDLKALSELAHAHGALMVVDATHSAGVVPIDAPALGVDILATGSFKWLCAYSGTGCCYVRAGLIDQIRPVMVGSRTKDIMAEAGGQPVETMSFPEGAQRLEFGSSAHILRVAYASVIDYVLNLGIGNIERHVQALGLMLAEGLSNLGAEMMTPMDPMARAGIITARFPGHDAFTLAEALEARDVVVIVRMGDALRFSPHMFNNRDDVGRVLAVLGDLLR